MRRDHPGAGPFALSTTGGYTISWNFAEWNGADLCCYFIPSQVIGFLSLFLYLSFFLAVFPFPCRSCLSLSLFSSRSYVKCTTTICELQQVCPPLNGTLVVKGLCMPHTCLITLPFFTGKSCAEYGKESRSSLCVNVRVLSFRLRGCYTFGTTAVICGGTSN